MYPTEVDGFLHAAMVWMACSCGLLFAAVSCAELFASKHDVEVIDYTPDASRVHCICTWTEMFYGDDAGLEAHAAGEAHLKTFRKGEKKCF